MGLQWQALACILSAILLGQAQGGVLKDILRHKRSPVEPEEENVTLPLGTQPINFNHVYNINVPLGALCSVDLDSPDGSALSATADSGDHHIEHTVDGENQIVFTHRINIPRQACACGQAPDLQDLLQRLELLEGQVSSLRDQCANGGCCGNGAQSGTGKAKRSPRGNAGLGGEGGGEEGRPPPTLSKREIFSLDLSPGSKISRVKCNRGDRSRGFFLHIYMATTGKNRDTALARNPSPIRRPLLFWGAGAGGVCFAGRVDVKPFCGGHGNYSTDSCGGCGRCVDGACQCFEGYAGAGCDRELCPVDCGQHGRCADGECVCDEGFTDHDCSEIICPRDCYDRGRCVEGQCFCDQGFTGEDCGELSCPSDCHDRGACVEGRCLCREGFAGEDCGELSCPGDCRQRGACVRGRCVCGEGYAGEDCGRVRCPHDCHDRGRCVDGRCLCQEGFAGEDCGEPTCPGDCHQRGRCANGQCVCDEGFAGADCGELACPDRCNNRGRCLAGQCVCIHPFTGPSCALLACANHCSHRGRCVDGRCVCDEGYIQEDLSPAKNLKVTEVTPETLDLEWYNEVRVNEYLITYVPTSPGGLQLEMRVDGDKMSSTVQELEPGVEYFINVYAILNNHRSVPVSARVATHLPTPDGLRFKSVKETSVHVAWDPLDIPFDGWELVFKKEDNGEISHNLKQDQLSVTQTGLAPGEEYDVSLYIIKNQTRGPEFKKPLTTMIDSPSEVEVNKVTDTTAHVTWFKPAARIDGINLSYGTPGGERTTVQLPDTESTHSISGLEPDTEYQVSLVSNRGQMQSVPATNTFRTDIDAPQNLRVVTQTDQSITLQWKNTRAPAGSYRVKYAPLSGGKHMETIVERSNEANTKITMTGLQPGTEYGFGVSAFQGNNRESAPATINAATELDDPKDLEVSERTVDSITLRWHRPQAVIKQYRIYYITPSGQRSEQIVRGDAITFILVDLDAGLEYTITLVAERDSEKSQGMEYSGTGEGEISNITVSDVTSGGLRVSWTAAIGVYDHFVIEYRDEFAGASDKAEVSVPGDALSADLTGLSPSTPYNITLYGIVAPGKYLTDLLSSGNDKPGSLAVKNVTPTSFQLSWTIPKGTFDSFLLTVQNVAEMSSPTEIALSGEQHTADVSGLLAGTHYEIDLYGIVQGQLLQPLKAFATTEAEPELGNLMVSDITPSSFKLSWTALGPYEGFDVEIRDSDGLLDPINLTLAADVRFLDVPQLSADTDYEISFYGLIHGQRTKPLYAEASTALGAPRGLRFENVTDSTVTLRWDHPRAKVNSFRITYVPTDGGAFQSVVVDGTKTKTTLYKLIPATEYRITIVSLKGFEESESISDTVLTVLDNPSALGVVNVTDSEALLVWQPTIAAVDGYVIAYTADYGITETEQVSGNTVQAELISLHPGTHYTVWMHAVKGSLQSLVSSTTFTTAIDPPTDLRASEITTNNALLSWKVPTAQITGYTLTLESTDGNMQVITDTDTSYSLAQLVPSMRYHVKLQANKGSQRSKIAETFFTAGRVLYPHPKDCSQTLLNGEASSGLYTIFLNGNMSDPLKVYCDMTTDGGGWVVFQRRQNGNVNFYRNWRNYSAGFGDPSDEFWLGLQSLHKITSHGRYELRVDLRDEGNSAYAVYDKFLVTDPRSRYKLHIGEYSGTAGDSLTYHQGRPFSTKDRDNDIAVTNCALSYKGAWWYKNCHRVNLNGVYGNRRHSQGINWYHWKGHEHSISFVEMKLRPHNFRDLQQRKRRQPAAR
uniref:Tenascin C n=1 Tax=Callorhinchus milii TaxID=7868 RepID=A0A4W3HRQ0_CALMI